MASATARLSRLGIWGAIACSLECALLGIGVRTLGISMRKPGAF
jgi:hypothetical protein